MPRLATTFRSVAEVACAARPILSHCSRCGPRSLCAHQRRARREHAFCGHDPRDPAARGSACRVERRSAIGCQATAGCFSSKSSAASTTRRLRSRRTLAKPCCRRCSRISSKPQPRLSVRNRAAAAECQPSGTKRCSTEPRTPERWSAPSFDPGTPRCSIAGLLSLDDSTRAWLATQPQLLKELATVHAPVAW